MTTHFPFGRQRVTGAQQAVQEALPLSGIGSEATPGDLSLPTPKKGIRCPRCRCVGTALKHVSVCKQCYEELRQEAERQQEAGYLCAWLRSRVDKNGLPYEDSALVATASDRATALRLVRVARKLNIPWTEPVQQVAFATRMRGLVAPYGSNAGDGSDDDGPDGGEAA